MFRKRPIAVTVASAGFWIWCALLSYPLIASNVDLTAEVTDDYAPNLGTLIFQAIGLLLFTSATALANVSRIGTTLLSLHPVQMAILAIIVLSLTLQFHDSEAGTLAGILYTCLLLSTAVMLSVLWTMTEDELVSCLQIAAVILCLFGITAILVLGWPVDRKVGNIQPNLFGAPLLVAFIFSQFHAGKVGICVRILCLGMTALVSSRFALIGCVVAAVSNGVTFNPLSARKIAALLIALAAVFMFWPQIASILALDDSTRDLSSGFSGRDTFWSGALDAITRHPFGVGFKRAALGEAGHNGYLKILVEFGVVGGGLMIVLTASVVISSGIEALTSAGRDLHERRLICARFAGLSALGFGGFFQPQLLNLGDAFGMAVLFLLFKPRFASAPAHRSAAVASDRLLA